MKLRKEDGKYYISTEEATVEVSKEVFDVINRDNGKMRADARKYNKCKLTEYWKCPQDCSRCPYAAEGDIISYNRKMDSGYELGELIADTTTCFTSIIEDQVYIEQLKKTLLQSKNEIPLGNEMLDLLLQGKSPTDIARELGRNRSQIRRWIKKLAYIIQNFDQ